MAKKKQDVDISTSKAIRPALTPEARENQLVALAVDLAEKQLREGTASSQVITHYLKLGTTAAQLEKEKVKAELEMTKAKTEAIKAEQASNDSYKEALKAFQTYSGRPPDDYTDIY